LMLTMSFMTNYCRTPKNSRDNGITTVFLKYIFPLLVFPALIFSSCAEDPTRIGIGLLPDDDFIDVYATDTIAVKAYTMYNELSLSSDSTKMIAGGVYDEYFGSTYCDFVTQLRLMDSLRKSAINIDSVFITFYASKVSGDTAALHYLRLYETGTELTDPDVYYSGQDPDTITFLGEYPMPVLKADSLYSVRLNNSVAEYLLRDTARFRPATNFYKEFFKGLWFGIRSETNPVLITLNAADNALAISVYYHDDEDVKRSYFFVATERAVNYNRFTHDRTTADPEKEVKHVNDFVLDTAVYLQTYSGVYARLEMPSLASFRGTQRIAVNKARIYAPVHLDGETYTEEEMPGQIYLRYRDSEGRELLVPDLLHDISFLDGRYDITGGYYKFNITTFVQQYLEGMVENPSVELFFPLSADKNVIFRANGNEPAIRFEFAYTIY